MRLYKTLSYFIIIVSAGLLVYLLAMPYEVCIATISKISGYGKTERIAGLLTPAKFNVLKFAPAIGVVLGGLLLLFARRVMFTLQLIGHSISRAYQYFFVLFRSFPRTEKLIFWLIILLNVIVKGYYLFNFPVTYDEAWTYINFTDRSMISSMTYYSAPNNHVFNSVLTNISNYIPVSATLRLRLPAFLGGILLLIVLYILSRRWFSHKLSVVLLLAFSFLTPQLFYSFAARGYIFVMLFSAISYFVVIRLTETKHSETRLLFYLSVSSMLGFYTMPSFLYPYVTLNLFLLAYGIINKRTQLGRKQVLWGIITTIGVVILYTPIFAISGIGAITSNSYVIPISRAEVLQKLYPHLLDVYKYLFIYEYALFVVYPVVVVACFISKHKTIAILNLWLLFSMPFIPVLHSVIPFERTWVYLTIPCLVSLILILQAILPKAIPSPVLYTAGVALATIVLLSSNKAMYVIEDYAVEAEGAVDFAWNKGMRSVYIKEPLMDTYLLYKYKTNARSLNCLIFEKDFFAQQNNVEYIIIRKGWTSPIAIAQPVFSNGYFDIYRNPSYINGSKP